MTYDFIIILISAKYDTINVNVNVMLSYLWSEYFSCKEKSSYKA